MKNILRLALVLAALVISLNGLWADGTTPAAPAAAPAATEPVLTISLPANLKVETAVSAITNAFTGLQWIGLSTQNATVTAYIDHHGVKAKAWAVCTATEIKVFADYKGQGRVAPDKAKANVDRWMRALEKKTKQELGLLPKKGEKKDE